MLCSKLYTSIYFLFSFIKLNISLLFSNIHLIREWKWIIVRLLPFTFNLINVWKIRFPFVILLFHIKMHRTQNFQLLILFRCLSLMQYFFLALLFSMNIEKIRIQFNSILFAFAICYFMFVMLLSLSITSSSLIWFTVG